MDSNGRGNSGRSKGYRRAALPRLLALCMLLLGFAVVCWGLHDKLSLYAPPHADQPVAKAKLMTEQERTPQLQAAVPQPDTPIAPVFVLLFAAALRLLMELKLQLHTPRFTRSQALPLFKVLHRRPPPEPLSAPVRAAALCAELS